MQPLRHVSQDPLAENPRGLTEFVRDDRTPLAVVHGFRDFLLHYRVATSPRADWTEDQYAASARTKRARAGRLIESFRRWMGPLEGVAFLDVACGDGSNCIALEEQRPRIIVGIDLDLRMLARGAPGEPKGRLMSYLRRGDERPQGRACFARMDATSLGFTNGAFDVLLSRSATEHIRPVELALREMVRVVRDGGLIYLGIDPYYWVRGCHKRGVVDIPWAHARLTLEEYRRFVSQHEGVRVAERRCRRLETLNRLTVAEWRRLVAAMDCEVLEWKQRRSAIGELVIADHPDVLKTLLPGVTGEDLLCERIEVWLRKPAPSRKRQR